MHTKWSLDALYLGFDDPKLIQDKKQLNDISKTIKELPLILSHQKQLESLKLILQTQEKYVTILNRLACFASLSQSVNTKDKDAIVCLQEIEQINNSCAKAFAICDHFIQDIKNLDTYIQTDPLCKEYGFYLKGIQEDGNYRLHDEVEEVIQKLNSDAGKAWEHLQETLTSSLQIPFHNELLTLSEIRNYSHSSDPILRKQAYEAELKAYKSIDDSVAFALNHIKSQVNTICDLRGFSSALEYTLYQSHMEMDTLHTLMQAIQEYLPYFQKYLKQKAKLLNQPHGLHWYDLFAPIQIQEKKYTIEEAKHFLITSFNQLDPSIAQFIETAFQEQWIDFLPYQNKVGGAFCLNLPMIKQSRILTNFQGNFNDIVTLAHELGHAYHGAMIEHHRPLNQDYSMPIAETASTFQEHFILDLQMEKETNPIQKLAYIEAQLQDATQIICDIFSRFTFEQEVFQQRKSTFLFSDDLCNLMKQAQKKAYGDALDEATLHPYMWINKSHYYSPALSFYNFPYTFGGLFARGLLLQYKKDKKSFLPKYQEMLKHTTTATIEEIAQFVQVDVTDIQFWREALNSYKKEIEEFITLSEQYDLQKYFK